MPELPEVEILVRHLRPLITGKTIRHVTVFHPKLLAPTSVQEFSRAVTGKTFTRLSRRGKYLLFELSARKSAEPARFLGHLGMTGRIYPIPKGRPKPKHAIVEFDLGSDRLIFEDVRRFGRMTLDLSSLGGLGPEPLKAGFKLAEFILSLKKSKQSVKIRLLDQSLVAGVGNIYASEALFRARLSPTAPANQLAPSEVARLWKAIREVLTDAIRLGRRLPLSFDGGDSDGLFYFGRDTHVADELEERFRVYDRANLPCPNCGKPIQRMVQAARSTFYCADCQRRPR